MSVASEAAVTPAPAFKQATSGASSELPYRDRLESAFGVNLGHVHAHLGNAEAKQGLSALDARAAAHGAAVAFRESSPSLGLVAHETAHVIQQGAAGGGGVQRKATGVSAPGDAAEARADAAAAAVVAGQPVPDVGTAPGEHIHRDVDTSGGKWSTPTYSPQAAGTGGTGDWVGCSIELHFTPNELIEACVAITVTLGHRVRATLSIAPGLNACVAITVTLDVLQARGDVARPLTARRAWGHGGGAWRRTTVCLRA